jgi:hypothetical protein
MMTPVGTRLKAGMTKQKINKSDFWQTWIDREFIIGDDNGNNLNNPWL